MDLNAAGLLHTGADAEKLGRVPSWRESGSFSEVERTVLAYAEAMTRSDEDVDDDLFAQLRAHFDEAGLVELTGWVCLENLYSKFNRSFRIDAQGFCVVHRPEAG